MNNVTTPQTSAALKAAGFPQPVPEFGQVWHDPQSEREMICVKSASLIDRTFAFIHHSGTGNIFFAKDVIFAPAATDILRELDADVSMSCDAGTWLCCIFCGPDFAHDNPAEAAALAWMEANKH